MRINLYTTPSVRKQPACCGYVTLLQHYFEGLPGSIVSQENPDIIHFWGCWNWQMAQMAQKAVARRIPYIFTPAEGLQPWNFRHGNSEKQLQATALKSNAEELYKQGKYTQEEYEDSQEVIVRLEREAAYEELERNSLIPSLKTVEQKKKMRSLLNELKSCIGTQAQREFYKNYAYNLKNYVRICGANIDSADNSLGSYISGMDEKKLGVLIGSIKFDFVTSQDAVRRSMNHKPNLSPTM